MLFSLLDIREYGGSKARAWEELTFQLRPDPSPGLVEVRKTRAPDGGVEWYEVYDDGHHEGFQAKFYSDLESALGDMKRSVDTVATSRPEMTRLTFVVPFDFTDIPSGNRMSDQTRWDSAIQRWSTDIEGAQRLTFAIIRGGQTLDQLTLEQHAGRRAFWFQEFELSSEWLRRRWSDTREVVGERYTPEAHTAASVEHDLAAVALTPTFVEKLCELRSAAVAACDAASHAWGPSEEHAYAEANFLRSAVFDVRTDDGVVDFSHASESARRLATIAATRRSALNDDYHGATALDRVSSAARALIDVLTGSRAELATTGVVALTGPAGQGKTHSLLHTAKRLLDDDVPVIILAGQRFGDRQWWPEVAGQLGGLSVTSDTFLAALSSMAQARGRRAMVVIDALNESKNPAFWAGELPSILAQVTATPWLGLIVTWREDYDDVIAPPAALPKRRHRGLVGAELEALNNYCQLFGVTAPVASRFDPAFANPLFLRMYCEVLASDPTADLGGMGRSTLFARFAKVRGAVALKKLRLNPSSTAVDTATGLLADALIANGGRAVPRNDIEPRINALQPDRTEWPETLFGALRSEGLIETQPATAGTEVVAFPFQAFSEHLVVSRFLDRLETGKDRPRWRRWLNLTLRRRSSTMRSLTRKALRDKYRFWRAAAVLLPERYGVELRDLIGTGDRPWVLEEATWESLTERAPAAFGARAFALLESSMGSSGGSPQGVEAILTLAARPDHPANALWLHKRLRSTPMSQRDATWGIATFDLLDDSEAFERIIVWALRQDGQGADEETVLAALPLVWLLTSSNRPMRDQVTKILVQLLYTRLATLARLLETCRDLDDDYLRERLITAAYGAVMRGGDTDPVGVRRLAEELHVWRRSGQLPVNVLARDSARGIISWAYDRGIVNSATVQQFTPPYGADPPTEPPTAEDLKNDYGWIDGDPKVWRAQSILSSCLDWMGDFHKYVIASDVDHFSLYPLDGPTPVNLDSHDPLREVDANWAGRWIAWRALSLGWTPEAFEELEHGRDLHHGRDAHKPERFGKKYQWIAHHELMARLADNFHPSQKWNGPITPYEGPWPWFGRDIDPSLAPSNRRNGTRIATIADDDTAQWAIPRGPAFTPTFTVADWIADRDDLPTADEVLTPRDNHGHQWVALHRYSKWSRRRPERKPMHSLERELYLLQFAWLTRPGTGRTVYNTIRQRGLHGRWMPDRNKAHRQYVGEGGWSPIAHAEPATWERPNPLAHDGLDVLPATETYLWEGNTLDCSLDQTLDFHTPIAELLGNARWDGTRPQWTVDDRTVARALINHDAEGTEHTILIADPAWLDQRLTALNLELVIGTLGERQATSPHDEYALSWSEVTYASLAVPGTPWEHDGPLPKVQQVLDDD